MHLICNLAWNQKVVLEDWVEAVVTLFKGKGTLFPLNKVTVMASTQSSCTAFIHSYHFLLSTSAIQL